MRLSEQERRMKRKQHILVQVPVSTRAVIQRINRKLKPDNERLKVTRGDRWRPALGDYYVVNFDRNRIVNKNVDPEALGRELDVLKPHEAVVS
jgi:hypothetical protein